MLSAEEFERWCHQLALSEQAKTLIACIRSSPPSRLVQSAAGNVSGRYPSKKMGCSIQFESHRDELPFIYDLEHDPAVLEFYDQPDKIDLVYQNKDGTRGVSTRHTPDFFVIREDGAGWVECKMEDQLVRLAEKQPHRFVHNSDGSWSCPPGAAYAEPFGLSYRLFSSREINWIVFRNLRFLQEYAHGPRPGVPPDRVTAIRTQVMRSPGVSLLELLRSLPPEGKADDIYFLIVTEQLYVDLSHALLPEPERVHVFPDREIADAHAAMTTTSASNLPRPYQLSLAVGTLLWWVGSLGPSSIPGRLP